jgi:hypothetical protein
MRILWGQFFAFNIRPYNIHHLIYVFQAKEYSLLERHKAPMALCSTTTVRNRSDLSNQTARSIGIENTGVRASNLTSALLAIISFEIRIGAASLAFLPSSRFRRNI